MAQNEEPFQYDFGPLEQGTYFERGFTITQNLADFLVGKEIEMRVCDYSGGRLRLDFKLSNNTIVLTGLTLVFKMSALLTNIKQGTYKYDVKAFTVANPADKIKIMEGKFRIDESM
jgi:hypothetical protein